ncbi:uncharacterized protein PG998_008941 [Apiospora kogelbergensis]|uniref:Uncharacterized protein n=1 Tax=Apiospora kogelbergensis TaxID=1337665 RepID=A0AAW0R6I6_9PEZI
MASATTINIGSLTTTFTPAATNCLSFYQAWSNNNTWLQYGTAGSANPQCFPSGYTATDGPYYSPGICPAGYRYACSAGIDESATIATCCPSGYVCQSRSADDLNACSSKFPSDTYLSLAIWSTIPEQETVLVGSTTFKEGKGWPAWAHGIIIRRSGDDPTWPGASGASTTQTKGTTTEGNSAGSTSASSPGSRSSVSSTSRADVGDGTSNVGLSSGAKIGIGVGASLGCILLGGSVAASFLLLKRRRRSRQSQQVDRDAATKGPRDRIPVEMGSSKRQFEIAEVNGENSGRHHSEMPAYSEPAELDSATRR